MLGKRTLILVAALVTMLLTGRSISPVLYRALILNPELTKAIRDHDLDRTQQLVARGADVNLSLPSPQSNLPQSCIALAVWSGDVAALQSILEAGAVTDLPTANGTTPLMLAASRSSAEVVRVLLNAGADPNARDKNGETALMYAAGHGWTTFDGSEVVCKEAAATHLLLTAGADPNLVDTYGETALSKAEQARERKIASALRSANAVGLRKELIGVPQAELFYAVRTQDLGAVKRLIRYGARVAVQDDEGATPLMYAAVQFDGILIRYLLRHAPDVKASLELRDQRDETVLYRSRAWDYSFRLLLEAGADPNGTGPGGRPYSYHLSPERWQQLVQAGARSPS
jgi:ankyrin repeat protein